MEKVRVGLTTTTNWSDPAMCLIGSAVGCVVVALLEIFLVFKGHFVLFLGVPIAIWAAVSFVHMQTEPGKTDKYLVFHDKSFESRWAGRKIPMATLVTAYLEGKFDFKNDDVLGCLRNRHEFVCYKVDPDTFKFLLQQFIPGISSSFYDKTTSKREIADHYDRQADFFHSFLGDSMVYTCAMWKDPNTEALEVAQARKMSTICRKLQLQRGHKFLDIGCGWGTLARHAESEFGAKATGVTLSTEGARYARDTAKKTKTNTEILEMDYRDIPRDRMFDRITAIEMAEHVGISKFPQFLGQVKAHLDDDGVFLMQVAGLRQSANWEDIAWGLFMSRYIFPAADASTPLHWYVRQLEQAGFEVRSVETIGRHYSHTLHHWYKNFMRNLPEVSKKYPDPLVRLWKIFLSWSVIASGQGSATCYQLTCHKNSYHFDRDRFVGEDVAGSPLI